MAQKVVGYVKLQIPAGKATPAPPVGPALGQHGINIAAFTKEFNERTKNDMGLIIPVVITVYTVMTTRRPQQGKGRHHLQGLHSEDRRAEDARPERRFSRGCHEHDRRYGPFHGRRRRRVRRV